MATPSSTTTILRMTEHCPCAPHRLMRKAKELPHPPHRVTKLWRERKRARGEFSSAPPSSPLVTQLPFNQTLTSLPPGLYLGSLVTPFVRRGMVSFSELSFPSLSSPLLSSGHGVHNSHSSHCGIWPFAFDSLTSRARVVPYCSTCGPLSAKAGPRLTFPSSLTWTRNQSFPS